MSLTRLSVYLSMPRRRAIILPTKMPEAGALMAMMAKPINVAHLQKGQQALQKAMTFDLASRTLDYELLGGIAPLEAHAWPHVWPLVLSPGLGSSRQQ